ncbi:MAG TPA: DUF3551 domain-containing protein [Xanthobacteraceae bacterium]
MRTFTMPLLAVAAVVAAGATGANAQPHPWCMIVQGWGGGWACGFDTFEQCLTEARAGNSGFCAANPAYKAPAPAKPSRRKHKT